jgi:argininosuccinate lyase
MRLWDKGGDVDAAMMQFTARDDWSLDRALLPFDLRASRAHVRGLARIGVLAPADAEALDGALADLEVEAAEGRFAPTAADEDGHSAIENALVARLGDAGKRVHLGRSRNDQVLVALRLYERDALATIAELATLGARALLDRAEPAMLVPMPGYTHLQRAVPSSLGLWFGAFADGLVDAASAAIDAWRATDRSPLGAAAGYGVNLALDREGVARDLGFGDVAFNPIASQTSRGIVETQVLSAAWVAMAVVRRFAWDLSLFATSEVGFVKLDAALTTGSSIMPNKRNPDVVELLRAACAIVQGALVEVMSVVSLPSGYHRDLQLTKAPLMRALDETRVALALVPRLARGIHFDEAAMAAAVDAPCFATDRAVTLAVAGVPFRDAYRRIADDLEGAGGFDAVASLRDRVSPGAPGAPRLDVSRARLDAVSAAAAALRER